MNLLEKKRKSKITQTPRRDQMKLDHMRNDINRNKSTPSKNVSLMYYHNNDTNNVVIMEKEKKSVSIMPKEKMNEIRMGEKGTAVTLNDINKKISINQVKNVYSGYNKFWTYNGAIYGVKPGFIDRLDVGSTPIKTDISNIKGFSDLWYNTDIDVTNDRTHYEESSTDKQYKTVAPYTSYFGTDTYQLSDNLMNRSDKLLPSSFLRYNRVRSTYVNIPVNNRVETRYRYEDVSIERFRSEFPNPADTETTTYETVYQAQQQTVTIANPLAGKRIFYVKGISGAVYYFEIPGSGYYIGGPSYAIYKNGNGRFVGNYNTNCTNPNDLPWVVASNGSVSEYILCGVGFLSDGTILKLSYTGGPDGLFCNFSPEYYRSYNNIYIDEQCTKTAPLIDGLAKVSTTQPATITTTTTVQVPVQIPHLHRHQYSYTLEYNGSYNYVVLHDRYYIDGTFQSESTSVVKEYKTQVPYQVTIAGSASPIMYGDYVYKSRLETRYRTETRTETWITYEPVPCYWDSSANGGQGGFIGEWFSETLHSKTVEVQVPYQVTVYDPQYIPGIIAPNNFKWVDVARYLYNNNKIVRGQYNIGAYSSYANRYNNTPYYAIDYSEYRRNTYHNGVRTIWPRTTSILFEKSAGQTEPYPQPNVTYIGNLTNNKTHFNSLSAARYI